MRVKTKLSPGTALASSRALVPSFSMFHVVNGKTADQIGESSRAMKTALVSGQRVLEYYRPYPGSAAFIVGASVIMKLTFLLLTIAPGLMVDVAFGKGDRELLGELVKVVFAAFGINLVTQVAMTRAVAQSSSRIMNDIRFQMFAHLQKLSLDYYGRNQSGDLVARFTSDLSEIENMLTTRIPHTTLSGAGILLGLPLAFALQWELAILMVAIFPLVLLISAGLAPAATKANIESKQAQGKTAGWLQEQMQVQPVVKAFSLEPKSLEQFRQKLNDLGVKTERSQFLNSLMTMLSMQGGLLTVATIFGAGAGLWASGAMSLGQLVAFSALTVRMNRDLYTMSGKVIPGLVASSASLKRFDDILKAKPQIVDAPAAYALPRLQKEIRFADVQFGYDGRGLQLDKFNLTVPIGSWVAF
ncbi:MAG: ABC transporter ATP-binding protein, partial [Chloroflexi bacterium]|nr:ABC transporter ATP-binding protein [Chloroflexota bacterium]